MVLLEDLKDYDTQFVADDMIRIGDNIYVLELNGKRMLQYDIEEKKCQYYYIGCHKQAWGNYTTFAQWKGQLYIFPKYKDVIVKFEINTKKIKKIHSLYSKLGLDKLKLNLLKDDGFFCYGFQDRNIIWLFLKQSNLVIAYDLEQGTWKKYELSEKINNCIHAVQYGGYIYILSSEGKIYCWDATNGLIKLLVDCSDRADEDDVFSRIAVTDRNIFLFPALGEDLFCIDLEEKHIEKYMAYPRDFKYCVPDEWSKYYGYCEDENFYYFAMRSIKFIACVNKKIGSMKWIRTKFPVTEKWTEYYIKYSKNMINEKECSIDDAINYLSINHEENEQKKGISIGNQIFKRIR